jgi:uncharacterized protein with PIN domain
MRSSRKTRRKVKFWDASAVVALLVDEAGQARGAIRRGSGHDRLVVTRTECISALVRRERDGSIAPGCHSGDTLANSLMCEVLPTTSADLANACCAHRCEPPPRCTAAAVVTAADDPAL